MKEEPQKKEEQLTVVDNKSTQLSFNYFNPQHFETMQRVATMFANSELVPEIYKISKDNPKEKAVANCVVAIEMAQRMNASTLMVMQNMSIIYGRPAWSSQFLIATVNAGGKFYPLKFEFTEKGFLGKIDYTVYEKVWDNTTRKYRNNAKTLTFDGTKMMDIECVAYTRAKGSDKVLKSTPISLKTAILEGWYTKSGSKWPSIPQQMLLYRAGSFWTKAYAPEISMGMMTKEEAFDIIDIPHEVIESKTPQAPEVIDLPDEVEEVEIEEIPEPTPEVPEVPEMQGSNTPKLEF